MSPFTADEKYVRIDTKIFKRPRVQPWNFDCLAVNLYVDPRGNDLNDGTRRPFRTIQYAMSKAQPGDVVRVRKGLYEEQVTINRGGEKEHPIVLTCAPDAFGEVQVYPKNILSNEAVITVHVAKNITINGLIVQRDMPSMTEHFGGNGITFNNGGGPGCVVQNCLITGNPHCGIKEMGHGGEQINMTANVVCGNGHDGQDHGIYIPANDCDIVGNIVYRNTGWGLHLYTSPRCIEAIGNLIASNGAGIVLGGQACTIYHNTIYGNSQQGLMYFRGGCVGNIIKNNISWLSGAGDCFYDNGGGHLGDPKANFDKANTWTVPPAFLTYNTDGGMRIGDPKLISPDTGDYTLRPDSPCVLAGTDGLNVGAY